MHWLEISLQVDPELAEAVADMLGRYAPGGVACQQNALDIVGGQEWRPDGPLEPLVTVLAYLPLDTEVDGKRQRIEEALWHLGQIRPLPAPQFRAVAEEEWANAWKEHFHVTRIGQRFVIKPSWRDYDPQPTDVIIELDPGQAFGTGLHPTTQMCLAAIEKHLRPSDTVLDLGTGSGILAIAAAKLGAQHVLAVDIDPVAVRAAQANINANHVSQTVMVGCGSLAEVLDLKFPWPAAQPAPPVWSADRRPKGVGGGQIPNFKFVLVNILAKIIVELCEGGLRQAIAPGGLAVFAGLIDAQETEVRHALAQAGLELIERRQEKDWVGLICRR